MNLWRCSIALSLGLVWYLSDCGRTVTQYVLCVLFCFVIPCLLGNSVLESSTQTDEETKENHLQEIAEEDVIDGESSERAEPLESQYPHVKRSLRQVFECVYAQLFVPWYCAPEPLEHQPLHQALGGEFDLIIDRLVEQAKDFDICQAVVGSIHILTQHLHDAKQSSRYFVRVFEDAAEEVAVLREFSDALVRNLFPKSLWSHGLNRCALNEMVALKGFGLLVEWLSNPDNLNQLILSQLDNTTPKGSVDDLCGSDPEQCSLTSEESKEDGELGDENAEKAEVSAGSSSKGKRKANKLKQGWSKFVDKIKSKKARKKKMKRMERELMMRMMAIQDNGCNDDDGGSSREGSIHSQQDSDREDSDLENYLTTVQEDMMEFKLSYEMWRVGRWSVSIPHAGREGDKLTFTVHVEEKNSPENLQWDIRKTYVDVIYFRNIWQDSTTLPSILLLEESQVDEELKEKARLSVEHFLQELVSDNLIGHTQPVFQFLCPLDKLLNEEEHYEGVWGLLSGLAYFLTPGQEEEEALSPQTEVPREIPASLPNPGAFTESGADAPAAIVPTIVISGCDSACQPPAEAEAQTQTEYAANSDASNNGNCSQDKTEDSDNNPLAAHLKMIIKGLSRSKSQESLTSIKSAADEEPPHPDSTPHRGQRRSSQGESAEGPSWLHFGARSNKKEKASLKMSNGLIRAKAKEQGTSPRAEDVQGQRSQVDWEQLEATKAIFDLLKEISGNSILINIFDAILKPVMPILKKKVNSFLNKMNPTEAQMAAYIDALRDKQWPEFQPAAPPLSPPPPPPPLPPAPAPPRTEEDKTKTRERAHGLINARCSNYLILKKTDVESVFNLYQDVEENKKLVYMLLAFLLREFFPKERSLKDAAALINGTIATNGSVKL